MSRIAKLALVALVCLVAIGATRLIISSSGKTDQTAVSVSPADITRSVGPLPEQKIDSYF